MAGGRLGRPRGERGRVTVEVSNTYVCGRQSGGIEYVRYPMRGECLDAWWDEEVSTVTGDGHPCGSSEHALYEAVVLAAPHAPELVGHSWSWEG
jgi:hypothetical protein